MTIVHYIWKARWRVQGFPQNTWWAAARRDEVGRELLERLVAGTPLVLYRTLDGRAVALDNRCVHRSFPLSKGTLVDDNLRCGYHGFVYGTDGRCVCIPSQQHISSRVRVQSFPVFEGRHLVWVWIGDPAQADPSEVPEPDEEADDRFVPVSGTLPVEGSWRAMHENLMDLTHLTFLHNGVGGSEAYAQVAPDVSVSDGAVTSTRRYVDDAPTAGWMLGVTTPIERHSASYWCSPAMVRAEVVFTDVEARDRGELRTATLRFLHCVTPATERSFNYLWVILRDFMTDNEAVSTLIEAQSHQTFLEDKDAIEWIHVATDRYPRTDPPEISVKADAAALHVRRLLDAMTSA